MLDHNISESYYDKIPNPVNIQGDTTTIFIIDNNKKVRECYVDTEDLALINTLGTSIRGVTDKRRCTTYAMIQHKKYKRSIGLHQLILEIPINVKNDFVIDHFDRNGLNNRKINLNKVTLSQNMLNKSVFKNNKLGEKNIRFLNGFYYINLSKQYKTLDEAKQMRDKIYNVIYENDYPKLVHHT